MTGRSLAIQPRDSACHMIPKCVNDTVLSGDNEKNLSWPVHACHTRIGVYDNIYNIVKVHY